MQEKMECQDERGIFKKFLTRGGGEGYFAGDERGWGATPSTVYSERVVLCCVVLCLWALVQGLSHEHPKKHFTY